MSGPLVSVVLPVYNGEAFLAQALDAILRQDHEPIEVVVVDDGSTDATADIARHYAAAHGAFHYLWQENAGPSAARNAGIAASSGDFVTFCDCDDRYHPNKVSTQLRRFAADPPTACVLVRQRTIVEPGTAPPAWIDKEDGGAQVQSAMVSREVIDTVGGYDPAYRMSENMEWLSRIKSAGFRVDVVDDVVVDRRLHGANLSYDRRALQHGLLASLRSKVASARSAEEATS